jgi:hypothetical protein
MAQIDINEVRSKFPQYSDVSDEVLLRGVHDTYYKDIPFEQFASNIKITAPVVQATAKAPTEQEKADFEAMQKPTSTTEQMFGMGSPTYSLIRGAIIEPVLGANQLLANTGIFGQRVKEGANALVQEEAQASAAAREAMGREGFDFASLAGGIVSPANKLAGASRAISALGKVGENIAQGAFFGAIQPVEGQDYVAEKNFQLGIGALFSGSLGLVGELTPKVKEFLKEIPITAKNKEEEFKKYFAKLLPEDRTALAKELQSAGEIITGSSPTVSEALSDMPSAYKIAKAQERLESKTETAGKFIARSNERQSARMAALEDVFGSQADLELAREAKLTSTMPMRERALSEANFYGETATKLEQAYKEGSSYLGSVNSKDKNDILKGQIENIKANGYYPLTSEALIGRVDSIINSPGTRSNEMLTYAVSKLRGKLAKLTDSNGIINSADLYNIRKEINLDVAEYLGSKNLASAGFRGEASKVESSLKKTIDAEINKAAGSTLWTDYLAKYASHSKKINQLELGQGLKSSLEGKFSEETAGKFLQAMTNLPATIKNSTGQARYTSLSDVLEPNQVAAVNKVYADVLRQEKASLSGKGIERAKAAELNEAQEIPSFISAKVTLVKNILRDVVKGTQADFDSRMAELLLDPAKFATFLESVPNREQEAIFKVMQTRMKPSYKEQFLQMYKNPAIPTAQEVQRGTTQQSFK